ncbi:MAG TPA: agmatinase [Methylomirabilota bacterium]|nr:agmatinase [Methylomirabilota bacterium]
MMERPEPRDAFHSPRFGQPPTFMRLPHIRDVAALDVALVGIPYDGGTSYRPGARYGPRAIRDQSSLIRPWNPALQVAPFARLHVVDWGDVDVAPVSIETTFAAIERETDRLVGAGVVPLSVGGDHSITLPILRSLARRWGALGLVHFDAHPDTWDEYMGSRHFHGTTFRRAVEEGLVNGRRAIQIGIRGPLYGPEDFDFHRAHGLEVIRIEAVKDRGCGWVAERLGRLAGAPVYCSFDIDAVDPAYAPATGTPEVGGLTSWEALVLVRALRGLSLVGADVVEVSPPYDGPGQVTSLLAANLLFELLSVVALAR